LPGFFSVGFRIGRLLQFIQPPLQGQTESGSAGQHVVQSEIQSLIKINFCGFKTTLIFAIRKIGKQDLIITAEVAHLVERDLAKVEVAGSSPVFRSKKILSPGRDFFSLPVIAPVVELVDTQDLKSCSQQCE
jgi:hypothetical protein